MIEREWNGMEWNGMEWNGMERNGMEWNGMEWNGMEWNGPTRRLLLASTHDRHCLLCVFAIN
jgi:hypothetical protein